MNDTLVVYSSKHGICEKVAGVIAKKLGCPYQDANNLRDIKNYKTIIIGSSIYMGKGSRVISTFLKLHKQELMDKNLAFFIVCCQEDDFHIHSQLSSTFPSDLLNKAFYVGCLGRGVNINRLNLLEKKILNKSSGICGSFLEMNTQEQEKLINAYKKLC